MPDAIFAEPRLAEIYDAVDHDRSDLAVYLAITEELGASSILDIGCGTGTFACLLALRGKDVTGVDPAAASLEVARRKPGAQHVRWLRGDAAALPPLQVDLVTMTGNVAQVFLTDDDWTATLRAARSYFDSLLQAGVEIHEYQDGQLHSKTLTIDGSWSMVGTPNFDARSLFLNFEVAAILYDHSIAEQLEFQFDEDLSHAQKIDSVIWFQRSTWDKIQENFCRLFSPVL